MTQLITLETLEVSTVNPALIRRSVDERPLQISHCTEMACIPAAAERMSNPATQDITDSPRMTGHSWVAARKAAWAALGRSDGRAPNSSQGRSTTAVSGKAVMFCFIGPKPADARHVEKFIGLHADRCRRGFVVCRTPQPQQLPARVTALPWDYSEEAMPGWRTRRGVVVT